MTKLIVYGRELALRHDDLPAFHAAYLVVAFLAAALFSLGLFAALIVVHMALDIVKYREIHGYSMRKTLEGTVRESLVDVMLLLIGLNFSVYLHHTMGIAGVSGLLRAELTLLQALGVVLPKFKILADLGKIGVHLHQYLHHPHPRIGKRWLPIERLQIVVCILCVALLVFASPLMGATQGHVVSIIVTELTQWVH